MHTPTLEFDYINFTSKTMVFILEGFYTVYFPGIAYLTKKLIILEVNLVNPYF